MDIRSLTVIILILKSGMKRIQELTKRFSQIFLRIRDNRPDIRRNIKGKDDASVDKTVRHSFCSEYGESGNNVLNYRVLYERVVFLSIPY